METAAFASSRARTARLVRWLLPAFVLLVPFVAMQFTAEVQWTLSDFVAMGVLLYAAVGAYELFARAGGSRAYRAGAALAVIGSLLLVWVNLAVGIIGSESHDANALYGAVLLAVAGGAALSRLRPMGMAWAMVAAALVQAGIGVTAFLAGWGGIGGTGSLATLGATALFVAIWSAAAALFFSAAQPATSPASTL